MIIKVKVNSNEDLKKVQEKVFENGGSWYGGVKELLTLEELLEELEGVEGLCIDLDYLMSDGINKKEICLTIYESAYNFDVAEGEEYTVNDFLAIENLREVLEVE